MVYRQSVPIGPVNLEYYEELKDNIAYLAEMQRVWYWLHEGWKNYSVSTLDEVEVWGDDEGGVVSFCWDYLRQIDALSGISIKARFEEHRYRLRAYYRAQEEAERKARVTLRNRWAFYPKDNLDLLY